MAEPSKFSLLHYISAGLFLVAITWLRLSSHVLENIIGGKTFAFVYGGIGLLLAIAWGLTIHNIWNHYYHHATKGGASPVLMQCVSIVFLTLLGSAFYNYETGKVKLYERTAIVDRASPEWLFLKFKSHEERFAPPHHELRHFVKGDSAYLTVGKGALGYEVVYAFTVKRAESTNKPNQ